MKDVRLVFSSHERFGTNTNPPKVVEKMTSAIPHISVFGLYRGKKWFLPKMVDRNLEVIRNQGGLV